jgi:hemoglobin
MILPRIDLTRQEITDVVAAFYARVRVDAVLGPVFAVHVDNWDEHEQKITAFWASAILHERSYSGNPMIAHMQAGNVRTGHFERWLGLFDEVLQTCVPTPQRHQWSALVHRIGRGLSLGLADAERSRGAVPRFNNLSRYS